MVQLVIANPAFHALFLCPRVAYKRMETYSVINNKTPAFGPSIVFSCAYRIGNMASPAMAMISNAAAVFVNLPTPVRASGQMQGQLRALQKPMAITNETETIPLVKIAPIEKQIPRKAQAASALL